MENKCILVVDDDVGLVELVTVLLKTQQYEVDIAYTGSEAIQKSKNGPDLILLDRSLPDIEGLEVCRHIREHELTKQIPIIILSARDSSDDKIKGLYIGADDYITKPFNSDELFARIEAALRRDVFSQKSKMEMEELVDELKNILRLNLITPMFQPIFETETLEPIGLEAFSHPPTTGSLNNATQLFQAAAATGLYQDLEIHCWEKAVIKWRESVNKGKLLLNCAPHFIEEGYLNKTFLSEVGLEPEGLMLVITSGRKIQKEDQFLGQLEEIKDWGVKVSIDDIGNGKTKLDRVEKIMPDFVKINMSFIQEIHCDTLKQNIVKTITSFCKDHQIETIAEGVEKRSEFETVASLGVDAVQGNMLGRPMKEINKELFQD